MRVVVAVIVEAKKDVLALNKIEVLSHSIVPNIIQFSVTWGRPWLLRYTRWSVLSYCCYWIRSFTGLYELET